MSEQIKAIKNGDIVTFGNFFRTHYVRLLQYCQLFVKDPSSAEDIVQETFINLWEKRGTLKPQANLEGLLFISLRNRCLNHLRNQKLTTKKLEDLKLDTSPLQFISQIDYLGAEETSIEERLIKELNVAVNNLPEKCSRIVKLTKFEGLKNREVAEQLGISVKAVERQLNIGKKKIEEHMLKNYPEGLILLIIWFN